MRKTPQQLCLNPDIQELSRSATLTINERSNARWRGGKSIYKCGLGQPPVPVPTKVVNTLKLYTREKDY